MHEQFIAQGWTVVEEALGEYTKDIVTLSKIYQDFYLKGIQVDPSLPEF